MDNKEIITEFLNKMSSQDNRCTAAPFYYVIRTEVTDVAPLDNCDEIEFYDPINCNSYESREEFREQLENDLFEEEEIEECVDRLEEYGIKKRWDKRGMFLTEEDAESHLKCNYYHYSSNAHTYVEHAWRAPKLKEFFDALMEEYKIGKS